MIPPGSELRVPDGEMLPPALRTSNVRVAELEHAVVAMTPYVRERLERDDEQVLMIEQLVVHGDEPLYVRVGYHPVELARRGLSRAITAMDRSPRIPSMAEAFVTLYGVPYGSQQSVVEAVPCEARTSRLLQVPVGVPVLLREMVVRDDRGVPWSLSYTHFRGDLHTVVAES